MSSTAISLIALLAVGAQPSTSDQVKLSHCLVSLIEEAQVPAEQAGVIQSIEVKEGMQVKTGDLLVQIDDQEARAKKQVAEFEYQAARTQAVNDIEVRYSKKAAAVAKAEYEEARAANQRVPGTYSNAEVRRLFLTWERSELQIERAQLELTVTGLTSNTYQARLQTVDLDVTRRRIESPLDGMVVQVYRHQGEWVSPGDPILRVVRTDRLRVEGFIEAGRYNRAEILGRPVTVVIRLAHNQIERLNSRITFVSPEVEASGEYRVWAEIDNRQQNGHWLLQGGLAAEMIIHLTKPN